MTLDAIEVGKACSPAPRTGATPVDGLGIKKAVHGELNLHDHDSHSKIDHAFDNQHAFHMDIVSSSFERAVSVRHENEREHE